MCIKDKMSSKTKCFSLNNGFFRIIQMVSNNVSFIFTDLHTEPPTTYLLFESYRKFTKCLCEKGWFLYDAYTTSIHLLSRLSFFLPSCTFTGSPRRLHLLLQPANCFQSIISIILRLPSGTECHENDTSFRHVIYL
jgi:hypothetical protein